MNLIRGKSDDYYHLLIVQSSQKYRFFKNLFEAYRKFILFIQEHLKPFTLDNEFMTEKYLFIFENYFFHLILQLFLFVV